MSTALCLASPPAAISTAATSPLIAAFLDGRCETTLRTYRQGLDDFAVFVGAESLDAAARILLDCAAGEANGMALAYRAHLVERDLAANTINSRLAALRSLVKLARMLGMVSWSIEVGNAKAEAYRDTRGPGPVAYRRMLALLDGRHDAKGKRDAAALRLMYDLALRRCEVLRLDLDDVDLAASSVAVRGKGSSQKRPLSLPTPTAAALRDWLEVRGAEPGPLFTNLDRAGKGSRLTGRSLCRIVATAGEKAGVRARPHGLRHSAITEALDLTKGNVRAVQKFSRHADLRILTVYDDNRTDLAGEVASLVAAGAT